jgi:branched-chain amino acid transport system substrate-binding protein
MGLTLLLAAALAATGARAETVKVGVVMTFSGGAAALGAQAQRALDLYLDMEGNAKLGPHKIQFIRRDTKSPSGEFAKAAVQELIVNEKVDIITGFIWSGNFIAAAPLLKESRTPTIILNAGTAWLPSLAPNVARVSFTMWHSGYTLGEYAHDKLGCKTAAVGYTDIPPGKDSRDSFVMRFEARGGKIVENIPMGGPATVPDFTPFMQRIKNAKPDCFYVFVPVGNHVSAMFKTYTELGLKQAGIRLIGPADITQDTELQSVGPDGVGTITMGHYQADLDNPANKAFVKAWKAKYGAESTPDMVAVQAFDAMAAIVAAVVAQNGKIDPDKTLAVWKGWKYNSPRGPIMIDPQTRDIVQDIKAFEIQRQGGRTVMKTLAVYPQVKDPCKVNKVGRCAE